MYSFVQSEYWGVGFLRYMQLKQVCVLSLPPPPPITREPNPCLCIASRMVLA